MNNNELNNKFFAENIQRVNKVVSKFLFCMIFIPIIFWIVTQVGIFRLKTSFCILLGSVLSFFTISLGIFTRIKNPKAQIFTMYYGLIGSEIFIGLLATNSTVNLMLVLGIVPFFTCFYYNKKLTIFIDIFCYFFMIGMLAIRSYDAVLVGNTLRKSFVIHYISMISGYTMEYSFFVFSSIYLSKRCQHDFKRLITRNNEIQTLVTSLEAQKLQISNSEEGLKDANSSLLRTQMEIIEFTAKILGSHDLFTGRHVIHTQKYVEVIAHQLRIDGKYTDILTDEIIQLYSSAAFLHDIGKIHIPEGILNKIGLFTPEEFELMKTHPVEGKKLIDYLPKINDGRFNIIAAEMAYFHHEKWNGSGYPLGLSAEKIPLCARIMAAADVLDALVSMRLYKDPVPFDKAMEIIMESSGTHFEPCIAEAVVHCRTQLEEIDRDFKRLEETSNKEELNWWKSYHENATNVFAKSTNQPQEE